MKSSPSIDEASRAELRAAPQRSRENSASATAPTSIRTRRRLRSRNATQRKPSHFGSYVQAVTERNRRDLPRLHRLDRRPQRQIVESHRHAVTPCLCQTGKAREIEATALCQQRRPEVAARARCAAGTSSIVKSLGLAAALDLFPRNRRRHHRRFVRANRVNRRERSPERILIVVEQHAAARPFGDAVLDDQQIGMRLARSRARGPWRSPRPGAGSGRDECRRRRACLCCRSSSRTACIPSEVKTSRTMSAASRTAENGASNGSRSRCR